MIKRHLEAALDHLAVVSAEATNEMPVGKFMAAKQDEDRVLPHASLDLLGTENTRGITIYVSSPSKTRG